MGEWTRSLARMAAALQSAASLRTNGLELLRRAKGVRQDDGDSYFEFLQDWVCARLRRARFGDPEVRDAIKVLLKKHSKLARYQGVLRSGLAGELNAEELRLYCLRYVDVHVTASNALGARTYIDSVLVLCQIASLFREMPELEPPLPPARRLAELDGDDVRLATCRSELAVRLALGGRTDEADGLVDAAFEVSKEIRERFVESTAQHALGLVVEARGFFDQALEVAKNAHLHAQADQLRLNMSRAILLQMRVAARL